MPSDRMRGLGKTNMSSRKSDRPGTPSVGQLSRGPISVYSNKQPGQQSRRNKSLQPRQNAKVRGRSASRRTQSRSISAGRRKLRENTRPSGQNLKHLSFGTSIKGYPEGQPTNSSRGRNRSSSDDSKPRKSSAAGGGNVRSSNKKSESTIAGFINRFRSGTPLSPEERQKNRFAVGNNQDSGFWWKSEQSATATLQPATQTSTLPDQHVDFPGAPDTTEKKEEVKSPARGSGLDAVARLRIQPSSTITDEQRSFEPTDTVDAVAHAIKKPVSLESRASDLLEQCNHVLGHAQHVSPVVHVFPVVNATKAETYNQPAKASLDKLEDRTERLLKNCDEVLKGAERTKSNLAVSDSSITKGFDDCEIKYVPSTGMEVAVPEMPCVETEEPAYTETTSNESALRKAICRRLVVSLECSSFTGDIASHLNIF